MKCDKLIKELDKLQLKLQDFESDPDHDVEAADKIRLKVQEKQAELAECPGEEPKHLDVEDDFAEVLAERKARAKAA